MEGFNRNDTDQYVIATSMSFLSSGRSIIEGILMDLCLSSEEEHSLIDYYDNCRVVTKAKKSVANFKVREGQNVGAKVTLRSDRMYEFCDKLFNIALPRVRDFRGLSNKSFDGRGNYAFGIKEQLIFPEIDYDKVEQIRGMDIMFVTTAKTDEEAHELLSLLGLPYAK